MKQGKGFLTIAQNGKTDYLRLAYLQALSIKITMPNSQYAVIVDQTTKQSMEQRYLQVFDHVIDLPVDYAEQSDWKLANEWQVFDLSPFKETIKVESDLLFTRDISHWWPALRMNSVVLSTGCRDYKGNLSQARDYRRLFDDNDLPDVYNGMMYFRYDETSAMFFEIARTLYQNWDDIRDQVLVNCREDAPSTDVVYAMTANILGREQCTMPSLDFFNFVHMKPAINLMPESPWHGALMWEVDAPMVRINNVNQYHPVHYHEKDWVTDDILEEYEQCLLKKNS